MSSISLSDTHGVKTERNLIASVEGELSWNFNSTALYF